MEKKLKNKTKQKGKDRWHSPIKPNQINMDGFSKEYVEKCACDVLVEIQRCQEMDTTMSMEKWLETINESLKEAAEIYIEKPDQKDKSFKISKKVVSNSSVNSNLSRKPHATITIMKISAFIFLNEYLIPEFINTFKF